MKLVLNYSPPAAELVRSRQIEIDYFKTPDWEGIVAEANALKPVKVHFNLDAGTGSLDQVDWERVRRLVGLTGTPYINLHLDARGSYYPEVAVNSTNKADIHKVYATILSDVMQVVERFGPGRTIIENCLSQGVPGNTLRLCVDPDLISRVVQDTGCGLLLDIAHAVIAARYLGMPAAEYFNRLPTHQLTEVQFAGMHRRAATGRWKDHLSIQKRDWHWLDWVLQRIRSGEWSSPWMLAFEYGGVGEHFRRRSNPRVIADQVPLLYERVKALPG